jgi:predicted alpha/beta-hydrolase family hydrolase
MRHVFLETLSEELASRGVATLRYQFLYVEQGRTRPDPPALLEATVRAAVAEAERLAPHLPRIAGGKSMGGRMTSLAASHAPLPGVRGLAFLGFPLHPAGAPGDSRAQHLADVPLPMLFLQGTRDTLADLGLITAVCRRLGARATLEIVEGADHGFHVLRRSGRTNAQVLGALADSLVRWSEGLP